MKSRRELRFRSAREFCAQSSLGISYPQYSRYEAGDQLPQLDQALVLSELLGIPAMEALLEWCQAQISNPDSLAREGIQELLASVKKAEGKGGPVATLSGEQRPEKVLPDKVLNERSVPLDDVIVFNRSHLKVFESDPGYRDLFTYINSFGPETILGSEVAEVLGIESNRATQMLEQLVELGVILKQGDGYRASKRNFYFPDDQDFFGLRNSNMTHNASSIMRTLTHDDLLSRQAYRGVVTRELTDSQVASLLDGVDQIMGGLVALPETESPRTIYSLCVLFGKRFARGGS